MSIDWKKRRERARQERVERPKTRMFHGAKAKFTFDDKPIEYEAIELDSAVVEYVPAAFKDACRECNHRRGDHTPDGKLCSIKGCSACPGFVSPRDPCDSCVHDAGHHWPNSICCEIGCPCTRFTRPSP